MGESCTASMIGLPYIKRNIKALNENIKRTCLSNVVPWRLEKEQGFFKQYVHKLQLAFPGMVDCC